MQVKPASARMVGLDYTVKDLMCPIKNIRAGCRILKFYQKRTKTLSGALRRYSGGSKKYSRRVYKEMRRMV